jgi:hypothetical protein
MDNMMEVTYEERVDHDNLYNKLQCNINKINVPVCKFVHSILVYWKHYT